ncbi:hypothetical protein HDU67_009443 [Dinochytrium kinnereticum]|nr:hypothetical protein HDU67_009443 [Dinochytrium kinnereticum]
MPTLIHDTPPPKPIPTPIPTPNQMPSITPGLHSTPVATPVVTPAHQSLVGVTTLHVETPPPQEVPAFPEVDPVTLEMTPEPVEIPAPLDPPPVMVPAPDEYIDPPPPQAIPNPPDAPAPVEMLVPPFERPPRGRVRGGRYVALRKGNGVDVEILV